MKKILVLFCCVMLFGQLEALPVGNPIDATLFTDGVFWEGDDRNPLFPDYFCWDALSYRVGFYADYVYNRKLQIDRKNQGTDNLHETQIETYATFLNLNAWNRIDLYAALGSSTIKFHTFQNVFRTINNNSLFLDIELDPAFSYTIGTNFTIWEYGCFGIGFDAKFFRTKSRLKFIRNTNEDPVYFPNLTVRYQEWQLALGAAYRAYITPTILVVPYFSCKWSEARADFGNFVVPDLPNEVLLRFIQLYDLKNELPVGGVFGISLLGCGKWEITAEYRFPDEHAFHLNTQFRF